MNFESGWRAGLRFGAIAFASVAGWVALASTLPPSAPYTTGECEHMAGEVIVLPSADMPDALCLKDGLYWKVRVDNWSRYHWGLR